MSLVATLISMTMTHQFAVTVFTSHARHCFREAGRRVLRAQRSFPDLTNLRNTRGHRGLNRQNTVLGGFIIATQCLEGGVVLT